jgi:hypothetical protein
MPFQPHLPLGPIAARAPSNFLPRAAMLAHSSSAMLASVLHRQFPGNMRNGDCRGLFQSLHDGRIVIEDIALPYLPKISDQDIDRLLPMSQRGRHSPSHRRLIIHLHLLAIAVMPNSVIHPEVAVTDDRYPLRCDVGAWSSYGTLTAFEAGATNGARIMEMLNGRVMRVIVIPYASLSYPMILGYAFSNPDNPPLPVLSGTDGRRAMAALTEQITSTLSMAA